VEIEFTEPAGDGADAASTYTVRSRYFKPTAAYGGPPHEVKILAVKSAALSADRRKVTLELPDMQEKRVINIKVNPSFKSQSGDAIWTKETWYTHNFAGPGVGVSPREVESRALARDFRASAEGGFLRLHSPFQGAYSLRLCDMTGARVLSFGDLSEREAVLPLRGVAPGLYILEAVSQGRALSRRVAVP
jgi:hypothetical protein